MMRWYREHGGRVSQRGALRGQVKRLERQAGEVLG